jgi:metal-responsive CopG/Arc/MetJ family transcriptional regulator
MKGFVYSGSIEEVVSMADMDDDRRQATSLRLPPSLLAELQEIADREKRTQTSIIEQALTEYLQRRKGSGLPEELERAVKEYLERHR